MRFPAGPEILFVSDLKAASYSVGTGGLKRLASESLSVAKVSKVWRNTFTPHYVFIALGVIKHRYRVTLIKYSDMGQNVKSLSPGFQVQCPCM
jgi:hypothetical protein